MDAVNGNFPKDNSLGLAKLGFDAKEAGDKRLETLTPDEIDGLKDRAASLKEGLVIAGGADSDGDAIVFYSLLADKQDKEIEKLAVEGEDEPTSVSVVDQAEEPVLEADEEDDEGENKNKNKNKNVGAKPQDPLGLGKLGYTKEQVDGWLAQGYSLSDIKNGVAASGEKKIEVSNEIAELA